MPRVSRLRQAAAERPDLVAADALTVDQKVETFRRAWADGLRPPERLDLDDWADQYRVLPSETSSEAGRWRTSRFPFHRRIMKVLSPTSRAREIPVIKGAQLGFTELCINWVLYNADQNPGPMMYLQKTYDSAKDFSTQKLEPNIRACEKVADKLGGRKPKYLADEVDNKAFPGGFIVLGGSNSGAFLRSKSIRDIMADEEDSYSGNVDAEGNPVAVARKRQANFPAGKLFRLSTPKFRETSTIEPAFDAGTREQFYIPCPRCNPYLSEGGARFVIRWENIRWSDELTDAGEPSDVWLECPHCGGRIDEHEKTAMFAAAETYAAFGWMTEKGSKGKPYPVLDDVERPSFQISSLYSPLGFFSWRDAVREWMEYRRSGDKALLQVFINQTLGESYSAAGQDISASWLKNRREEYPAGVLPPGVLVITAGADIQEDRIECEVVGWGLNGESWSLAYRTFYGATDVIGTWEADAANPTAWLQLDDLLRTKWRHPCGLDLGIECTLIDTGFRGEPVHVFCRLWEAARVYPVKGREGWGRGYIDRPKRRNEKYKTWDFTAWVDECKDQTYENLRVEKPGPGYCHFPLADDYSEKYFGGLTAENKKTKKSGGKNILYWDCPPGVRNEPLDCRVYAFAAFKVYQPNADTMGHRAARMAVGVDGPVGAEVAPAAPPARQVGHPTYTRGTPKKKQNVRRRGSPGL